MDAAVKNQNVRLNLFWKRMNTQYHNYAVHCGLSVPAMWILYALFENQGKKPLTQNDIVETWMYPKQTVNFTIAGLAKKGLLYLEQREGPRNSKAVCLTEAGVQLCEERIQPLVEAEERSLLRLSEAEREELLRLNELQCGALEKEIAKITGKE